MHNYLGIPFFLGRNLFKLFILHNGETFDMKETKKNIYLCNLAFLVYSQRYFVETRNIGFLYTPSRDFSKMQQT